MPAHSKVFRVLKLTLPLAVVLFSLSTFLLSQTSINDVHVVTRESIPATSIADAPQLIAHSSLPVIRTDARLVLVPVSVTDPMQRLVTGLSRDNFEVFEDKEPQQIQNFSSEDVPISLGIILDMSGSMADKVDRVREAVNQFCDAANPQDEFFMVTFADEPRLSSDFTNNPEDLKKELLFSIPKGRTSLLDAIYLG